MPRTNTGAWRALLAVAVTVGLAGCQGDQNRPPSAERTGTANQRQTASSPGQTQPLDRVRVGPVRVGLLAPLSGDFADAGRELANGAAMALFDTPGAAAEIVAFDTAGDIDRAREALALAAASQTDIVVGPLFGRNAEAIGPDLEAAGLTALSFSNDGRVAGARVFVVGHSVEAETTRILRHAAGDGARVVAVFGKADAVGDAVATQAEREADDPAAGLRIRRALYEPDIDYTTVARNVRTLIEADGRDAARRAGAKRLQAQLTASPAPDQTLAALAGRRSGAEGDLYRALYIQYTQLMSSGAEPGAAIKTVVDRYRGAGGLGGAGVDAVLLTMAGSDLSTVAPMFQLYDAESAGVRLLGLAGWAAMDPTRARELHGGRFAIEPYSDRFEIAYESAFGAPPTVLAGVAYDAVKLALAAAEADKTRPTPTAALAAVGEVPGARGPVRLSTAGFALRELEVLEVRPDGFFPVDPGRIVDPATPMATPPATAGS